MTSRKNTFEKAWQAKRLKFCGKRLTVTRLMGRQTVILSHFKSIPPSPPQPSKLLFKYVAKNSVSLDKVSLI